MLTTFPVIRILSNSFSFQHQHIARFSRTKPCISPTHIGIVETQSNHSSYTVHRYQKATPAQTVRPSQALSLSHPKSSIIPHPATKFNSPPTSTAVPPTPHTPHSSPSPLLMPSTLPSTEPPRSPSSRDNAICGKKFHVMLKCVEASGAASACTEKINDFLICERTVFRAAIRKSSQQPTPPTHHVVHPPQPPKPVSSDVASHGMSQSDADHVGVPQSSFDLFATPLTSVERVVRKQMSACSSLIDTLRRPRYQTQLLQFNRRMITDMRVTCEIIKSKALQLIDRLSGSSSTSGNGNKPSPR